MKQKLHLLGASLAMLSIAIFLISTLVVEISGTNQQIAMVKSLIVFPGLFILIPAIALTGITGTIMAKNSRERLIEAKSKRMRMIAANGLLVLLPSAIVLNLWASAGQFDTGFYLLQVGELIAGATNLILMAMNVRDGRKMRPRHQKNTIQKHLNTAPHGH